MADDYVSRYHEFGFAVVKGVFPPPDVRELARAFDRIHAEAISHPASFRHGNVFFHITDDAVCGRIARMVQWPSYIDPVLAAYRIDPRLRAIVAPIIGTTLKQIINQMHWKPPHAASGSFGFHQDSTFRRPPEAYRALAESYVQTAIAVDPHRAENGAMVFLPGSHRRGDLPAQRTGRVMETTMVQEDLRGWGFDTSDAVTLALDPGDVALWAPHTVHGSGPNRSIIDRRVYINGYVRAENCDRGAWAFRDGAPCPLGAPTLIHYEDLFERPDHHYVDEVLPDA